ncbi:replication initiation protein RepM [Acinetobacter baumannii]|jgi:plasmid replication initiation protein|uniref:RepB family plasmid replication initiator protein n=1 Tax=Acinetobacter pseudolwoffii TaxID=2053287 RepID=A0A2H9UIJ1_9GAMM|nr:replication initiation protein RepM [Acinetobacter pseudolwoffii]PJI31507.1 RepB family plasmid replication initiator protein [Acinetobacter pseudolwoffii]
MKNSLVVKDNALINASYNLELTEQRLIMLAIINARESGQGITADSKLEIHASDYAKLFNVSIDASYKALKEAVNNLFNRQFSYTAEYKRTGKTGVVRSRWVSRIFYVDDLGLLEITFAPDVVPLVTRLEEHFTSYQAKQVAHLTSKYATRLYELLIAWREVGKVPQIEISTFRNRLGLLENEYTAMSDFKKRVLEPSIKQINEHTDITVTYEQHKKGRLISGFSFKLKQKQQPKIEVKHDPNTPDFFIKLSDPQRHLFANKMSEMPEMSKYSQGTESFQQFAIRIADMLLEPKKFRELYPILEKSGFQP